MSLDNDCLCNKMFNVNDILDQYINGDANVNNVNNVKNVNSVRGSEYFVNNIGGVNNENIQIKSNIKNTHNISKGATLEDDEIFDDEGNLNMICKP